MDNRVVEFVRGLRAAGVRVSLAEGIDAVEGMGVLGVQDKGRFRSALRATLVKEREEFPVFDELFPLYFGGGGPAMHSALEDLSADDQEMLKAALEGLSGRLQRLMDWLTSGEGPTKEELERLAEQAGMQRAENQRQGRWVTRRMLQRMGLAHLEEQIQQLVAQLRKMGMSEEAIAKLMGVVDENREALAEQVANYVGKQVADERANQPRDLHGSDLMHKPFSALSEEETNHLRREVQRLVEQLRSRAALRRKRGNKGKFDAKSTIRTNQRYGGVPMELRFKKNKLKPSLLLICDVSTSMRPVAEFMLHLTYELQDQVAKTRSFAFNSDMREISLTMTGKRAAEAVRSVLYDIPPGYYATDLGRSLNTFFHNWLDSVDGRTTVVLLGDGRNNYNGPRLDLVKDLQRRAKRLVWFNPEHPRQWGTGDSDMQEYAPLCDSVYMVRNLAQLSAAIDKLMVN